MPVESAAGIWDLVRTNPLGTDDVSEGDNHDRLIKGALLDTFPNITEPVTVTAADLNQATNPVGSLIMTCVASTPPGYLNCQGQAVSRTTYADLYSAIGDLYGAGDGSTTFNLPDFQNRVAAGAGPGNALADVAGKDDWEQSDMPSQTTDSGGLHHHSIMRENAGGGTPPPQLCVEVRSDSNCNYNDTMMDDQGLHVHPITNSGQASVDNRQASLYIYYMIKT